MAHQTYLPSRLAVRNWRPRLLQFILSIFVVAIPAWAQTTVDLRTQTRNVDFSNASATRVWKTGTTLPSQCNVGEGFFLSSAPAGQNLNLCTASGIWTVTTAPQAGVGPEIQSVSGTFVPGAVPSIDGTGTEVSSGCTATGGLMTCTGGLNTGSGASRITATEGTAPLLPSTGQQTLYIDSADHNLKSVDSTTAVRQYSTLNGSETLSGKTLVNPSLGTTAITMTFPNETTVGTVLHTLAKLTGTASAAISAAVTDTVGVAGIVVAGAGTSGMVQIATAGQASCVFDGASTAGDYVTISATLAGACHDAGTTYPVGAQILGRVLSTNGSGGTYGVQLFGSEVRGSSASTGSSFNPLDYTTAWWRDEMTTNNQWFTYVTSGSGVFFGEPAFGDSQHPGVFQLQTGSTTGSSAYILLAWSNGAQVMQYPQGLAWTMEWIVKPASLSGANYFFGIGDNSQQNAFVVAYRPSSGADWIGISRNAGVETTVDLGIPASTTSWAKLQLRSDGSIVYFSLNGSPEKTICASGCTATAAPGLVNNQIEPYAAITSVTTGQQNLGIDFFAFQIFGLSR